MTVKTSFANRSHLPQQFSNLNDFKLLNLFSDTAKSFVKQSISPISKNSILLEIVFKLEQMSFGNALIDVND